MKVRLSLTGPQRPPPPNATTDEIRKWFDREASTGGYCMLEVVDGIGTLYIEGERWRGSESIDVDGVQITVEVDP